MHEAVNAEDFEEAATLQRQYEAAERDRMLSVLKTKLERARTAMDKEEEDERQRALRRGRRARVQREESLALETALHDAIADEDFRRAGKLLFRLRRRSIVWKLTNRLDRAVRDGLFEEATRLKRCLVRKYTSKLSPPLLEALGHKRHADNEAPGLRVGDVVQHSNHAWRGVVVGWHERCEASPGWIAHHEVHHLKHGASQRFYHVLPDLRDVATCKEKVATSGLGLWIAHINPAFLVARCSDDPHPFMQTGYIPEEHLVPLAAHGQTSKWSNGQHSKHLKLLGPLRGLLSKLRGPIKHTLLGHYFSGFEHGRFTPRPHLYSVLFHIPEWLEQDP